MKNVLNLNIKKRFNVNKVTVGNEALSASLSKVLQRASFCTTIRKNAVEFIELRTHFNSRVDLMREISYPKLHGLVSAELKERELILKWKVKLQKPILINLFALFFVVIPIYISKIDLIFYIVPIIMVLINFLINIIVIYMKVSEITEVFNYNLNSS